ncbi:replication restart helicase PriA [Merdimonas faecis]|uniref:Replication restart protein PriA n=1 Tax=Merdimonas faecis TaxID=1653435 RepID=A0A9D3AJH8_9FIRM|nr:primosomal protein N' [Merdimonas faecis]HJH50314.1 primosomal protein N' [Merdimonas faecis]
MYADIIIDITHEKLDKIFQYRIPSHLEGMLKIGMEVLVPFGRYNKETKGYVTGFSEKVDYDPEKIKEISGIVEGSIAIEAKLVALAAWMKEYYGGTMIQALKTVIPIKRQERTRKRRTVVLKLSEEEGKEKLKLYLHKNQKARARLLSGLLEQPGQDYELLTKKLHVTAAVIKALEEQGVIEVRTEQMFRNPIPAAAKEKESVTLTGEQQKAVETFWQDYEQGRTGTYLVYGVTGSGKTEVYMEMIGRVLKKGKQAIVLIPEIALTYQTVMRFYGRFGDRVSILHSRMSQGERYDQMERVKAGEVDVMIGPRSALFTPFPNLGLIVIDEEHEGTYKSEQVPRYHARETAIHRAQEEGASVVLGSATPSLESFYACKTGRFTMLELKNRTGESALPEVFITDMREELRQGNRSILSGKLEEMIRDRLERKEQIMLFLNRRGYAGFVSCRACGYVVKCPHCDVSLSAHRNGKLVCHYCGYETPLLRSCPSCGSSYIGGFRAGTQQVEELVRRTFPEARILRMDMDTTRKKDGYEKILETFADEEADILIGTQMIVKGHDFPKVTLVGVLAADLSLYSDDYRSGERTFQLLTQAAGRAGRGAASGQVVIQTYSPDHYSIQMAAAQDYEGFYEEEMGYRKLMGYPPASHLLAVLLTGPEEERLLEAAGYLKEFLGRIDPGGRIQVIGPASPYVGKVNDVYRKVLYLKEKEAHILIEAKNRMEQYIEANRGFQTLRIQFDLDPMGVF